jgi:hypothetical protein
MNSNESIPKIQPICNFFLNEIFSPYCRLQMYRVIRDLWTLLHNMISYVLVIKKRSYKHVSDLVRLRSYSRLKLRMEGKGC